MAPVKNKVKLTNAIIPKLESTYTWDTEIAQFGCRVFHKSGKRTFILRYRGINRKQREFRIGVFPAMDIKTARNTAKLLVGRIALGEDPQHERKLKLHQATTFNDVVDAYLVWVASNRKQTSIREVTSYCNNHIKPLFGKIFICDLTLGSVQRTYDRLHNSMATSFRNKMIDWARTIWNWGKKREKVEGENPFLIVKERTKKRRKRILQPEEFALVWNALEQYRYNGCISKTSLLAIEMFILTPLRKTEVFRLQWQNVDIPANTIWVKEHKNDHIEDDLELYITAPLMDLLNRIPRTRSPWVFPSPKSNSGHLEDISDTWQAIVKMAGIKRCTIHDMRRSWNSVGATIGHNPATMSEIIGNSPKVNAEHYWHIHDERLREISENIAEKITSYKD